MRRLLNLLGRSASGLLLVEAWAAATLWLPAGFWHQLAVLAFLLLVPGYYVFQAITQRRYRMAGRRAKVLTYSVGLSLISLMLIGLVINEAYTLLGFNRPLTLRPLTIGIGISSALLVLLSHWRQSRRRPRSPIPQLVNLRRYAQWRYARSVIAYGSLLLVLPLLAIGGANTLNNGGSNWLALSVLGIIAGLFVVAACWERRLGRHYGTIVFAIAVTLLLGTSMRGWGITGHDIMQEYQVFQLTTHHAAWHMQYYQDAYNACLSITILPTIISRLTGISDPYVYKFAFQLFAALIGLVLYSTLRDYVPRRIAFLATFLCISFPVFLTDITMLNRQETALLCFGLALQAGLDKRLKPATKSVLTCIFLVGMVWAHYSTSYVAVAILVLAALMEIVWRAITYLRQRRANRTVAPSSSRLSAIISLPVTLASLLILVAWGAVATQTSNNVTQTVGGVIGLVTGARPPATPATSNQSVSATQYATDTTEMRQAFAKDYYPDGQAANTQIKAEQPIIAAPNPALQKHGISSQLLGKFYDLVRSAYSLFIELGIVIGLVWWYVTRQRARLPRQYLLFGVAGLLVVAAQVVLPPTLINYGLTRVIQETLVVLALPIVLAWLWGMKFIRIPRRVREPLLAVILTAFFLILSGFASTLTGGYKPVLALSNTGLYYQAYYTHADEVSAAQWLGTQIPTGSHLVSDEFMRRKIIAYENIFAQTGLIPGAIPIDSYVVISHGDREFNEVPAYDRSEVIYYSVPYQFLDSHKDLVYSTGNVVIYK
jgi:uncharacterized membrane protein